MSIVSVLKTKPETVLDDYSKLLEMANIKKALPKSKETILKLNLSWTKYYPACSTEPWQLDGVLNALTKQGYKGIHPVENCTVVTDVWQGAKLNKWLPILNRYGLKFEPLTETEWADYKPKHEMLAMHKIFPEGFRIPKMFIGKNVVHLPTMKCVHPDTEIFREDGSLIKIRDLVDNVQEHNEILIEQGDQVSVLLQGVFSLSEAGIVKSSATHFWKTKTTDNLIYVRLKTGRSVKTSKTHPFLTQRGWVMASELNKRDRIAIPRMIDIEGKSQKIPDLFKDFELPDIRDINFVKGKKYDVTLQKYVVSQYLSGKTLTYLSSELHINCESLRSMLKRYGVPIRWVRKIPKMPSVTSQDLWEWMGLLLSEGYVYCCNGTLRTSWSNKEVALIDRYASLTKKLFGISVKTRKLKNAYETPEYYFDCNLIKRLYDFLEMSLPTSSDNKHVPPLLFKCTRGEIGAFLSGYIGGDGTVAKDGLHITSKSESLIHEIQLLLSRLGVVSFIKETRNRAKNSDMDYQTYYKISVYGEYLTRLSDFIQLISKEKTKSLHSLILKRQKSKFPSNWDTIPINKEIFRNIREGLGITQHTSGKPSSVNSIENGRCLPTRNVINYFISLFRNKDKGNIFARERSYLEFMASYGIAWDHIDLIKEIGPDTSYLYDLTVPGYNNFIGNGIILHNTHGHTTMTGAIKNSFGGLITRRRHHCHKMIHEVLVDLLQVQKDIHTGMFAAMDGTVCGDGNGPRTMMPRIKNFIMASEDQVAIDALSAKMMGFDPMKIPFIKMCHERGLGCGDVKQIDVAGEDVSKVDFGFRTGKSPVIFFDQLFRKKMKHLEPLLFHTPLFKMCVLGSSVYHDSLWYNTVGRQRISGFMNTEWGTLFKRY